MSQTVDGTVITVEYSRPQARGRDSLFGGEVKWNEVWTPGANWATTLEVNRDIELDGHAVPKGKYSVWMVVEPEQWTVVLDPRAHLFHMKHPGPAPDQIRYTTHTSTATVHGGPYLVVPRRAGRWRDAGDAVGHDAGES